MMLQAIQLKICFRILISDFFRIVLFSETESIDRLARIVSFIVRSVKKGGYGITSGYGY